jgi:simple sugar transport system ATP-binding protein
MSAAAPLPVVTAAPPVSLRHIFVAFGAVVALDDVSVDLEPGTRHAIVGENGAGKSTLMRVLFGQIRPDRGQIIVAGQMQRFGTPGDAIRLGIGMVHQHFELIGSFTVAENVVLGAEPGAGPLRLLDRNRAESDVARLAADSRLPLDPHARVDELSVAAQQRVEIVKALYRRARVLILDEPTAVLGPAEARELWAATARLSQAGTTVVFITHKLDEVMAHADHVTVLRRGRRVLSSLSGKPMRPVLPRRWWGRGCPFLFRPHPRLPFPRSGREARG